jgi:hypothetical protein
MFTLIIIACIQGCAISAPLQFPTAQSCLGAMRQVEDAQIFARAVCLEGSK